MTEQEKLLLKIEMLENALIELKTVLYGAGGNPGFIEEQREVRKKQDTILKSIYVGMGILAALNIIPLISNLINILQHG